MTEMETRYLQPSSLEELTACLGEMTEKSAVLAGGTDLMIEIRNRHPKLDLLLSLCRVKELKGITKEGEWMRIGAMETHAEIADDILVQEYFPALAMSCAHVGSKQIRNKGTIGGSLANASVAGDMLPCVCLFGGSLELLNQKGETRRVSPEEFVQGIGKTCMEPREVLSAVWLPIEEERNSCFVKLGPRAEVTIAEISLAISWEKGEEGYHNIKAVLGAVDTKPICLEEADRILGDRPIGEEEKEAFYKSLSGRIRKIRENRKRQPKLRISAWEREYKEYAVKSVVYDTLEKMREQEKELWA